MSKEIVWLGRSLADLLKFPEGARREAGQKLRRVQDGLEPTDYRPMRDVGPGVIEIRIHIGGEYRLFYVARHAEAIFVLHVFEKKARKTAQHDISVGRQRFREMMRWLRDRER